MFKTHGFGAVDAEEGSDNVIRTEAVVRTFTIHHAAGVGLKSQTDEVLQHGQIHHIVRAGTACMAVIYAALIHLVVMGFVVGIVHAHGPEVGPRGNTDAQYEQNDKIPGMGMHNTPPSYEFQKHQHCGIYCNISGGMMPKKSSVIHL